MLDRTASIDEIREAIQDRIDAQHFVGAIHHDQLFVGGGTMVLVALDVHDTDVALFFTHVLIFLKQEHDRNLSFFYLNEVSLMMCLIVFFMVCRS